MLIESQLFSPCSHLGWSIHHFSIRLQKYSSVDPVASSLIFQLTALHTAFKVIFLKIKIWCYSLPLKIFKCFRIARWIKQMSFLAQNTDTFLIGLLISLSSWPLPLSYCIRLGYDSVPCLYWFSIFLANSSWSSKIRMPKNLIFMGILSGWLSVPSTPLSLCACIPLS